jgi:hypothetical protein
VRVQPRGDALYSWEIAPHPGLRELEMLQEHRAASGELPYCNRHG